MPSFIPTKAVEAEQFTVSDEQKEQFSKKQIVVHQEGAQLKKDNDGHFAVISIKGEATIVREGDYLIKDEGKVVSVVSKAQFEANHKSSEVSEEATETATETPEA
jgi:Tfp pilus assembly protein PilP